MRLSEDQLHPINKYLLENIPAFMKETFGLDEADFKIISWVPMLYPAWELDDWAMLIETSDKRKILLHTDHGALIYVENPNELLLERIEFYQATIDKSKAALSTIEGN